MVLDLPPGRLAFCFCQTNPVVANNRVPMYSARLQSYCLFCWGGSISRARHQIVEEAVGDWTSLFKGSGSPSQPSQIDITSLFGSIVSQFAGSGITIIPDVRMAVGKVQSETMIMPMD